MSCSQLSLVSNASKLSILEGYNLEVPNDLNQEDDVSLCGQDDNDPKIFMCLEKLREIFSTLNVIELEQGNSMVGYMFYYVQIKFLSSHICTHLFVFLLFNNQSTKLDSCLKIIWQLVKFGESLLPLFEDDQTNYAVVVDKGQQILQKIIRKHTQLQKKGEKTRITRSNGTKKSTKNQNLPKSKKKLVKIGTYEKDHPEVLIEQPIRRSSRTKKGKISRYLQSQFVTQFQTQLKTRAVLKKHAKRATKRAED